jgi:undecaprenyl diphosphate synthase
VGADAVTADAPDVLPAIPPVVPWHVAIIMDGNGRWARQRGLPRLAGHRAGVENLRRIIRASGEFGVKVLTLYAFSSENWSRPREEVDGLMRLLSDSLEREVDELNRNGAQLRHLGEMEGLAPSLQNGIRHALELTAHNDLIVVCIALNYGGRREIVEAARRMLREGLPAEDVTEQAVSQRLYSAGLRDPDLVIRTAGEMRLSNFLIWQTAYAEFYSTPTYWPDFGPHDLHQALLAYGQRVRKFGGLAPGATVT